MAISGPFVVPSGCPPKAKLPSLQQWFSQPDCDPSHVVCVVTELSHPIPSYRPVSPALLLTFVGSSSLWDEAASQSAEAVSSVLVRSWLSRCTQRAVPTTSLSQHTTFRVITMLSRRLFSSSTSVSSPYSLLLRSYTSSPPLRRAPGIGDITHDGADSFNARQKEFRDNLEAAKKKKEQQDSQLHAASPSSTPASPTAPQSSNASDTSPPLHTLDAAQSLDQQALGSLSSHRTIGEARQKQTDGQSPTKRGPLSSLIYGTHEGQQLDKEMERSFSQVLARGKYVHSIVFHDVKPDKVDEYAELVGSWYPRMAAMEENRVNLVGSWRTEVGECDTFGTKLDLCVHRPLGARYDLAAYSC